MLPTISYSRLVLAGSENGRGGRVWKGELVEMERLVVDLDSVGLDSGVGGGRADHRSGSGRNTKSTSTYGRRDDRAEYLPVSARTTS